MKKIFQEKRVPASEFPENRTIPRFPGKKAKKTVADISCGIISDGNFPH